MYSFVFYFTMCFMFFNYFIYGMDFNKNMIFNDLYDKKYIFENGLKCLIKKNSFLPVVSVQVWVKAGSLYEDEEINGISHFLEHLVFKGTSKYDAKQINKKIEYYGAILNAGTSKEYTVYYIDIPKEGLEDAIDILSQLVFEATFPPEELEKERNVVIEEIKRSEDNPDSVLYEEFNKLLFTDTPYKWRIIGKEEIIRSISREKIIQYYKSFYTPSNMVVSICGDIDYETTKNLVEKYFGSYPNTTTLSVSLNLKESKKSDILVVNKHNVQYTYFLCGFLGPDIDDNYQYAGDVLAVILVDGLSSRLYRKLREEKKLVYEIDGGFYTQVGPSIFYISGICDRKNLEEIIREVKNSFREIGINGPSESELIKAKQIITTKWYFGNETVHSQAANIAWWDMFKSLDELNLYISHINEVSSKDIKEFINLYGNYLVTFALEPK